MAGIPGSESVQPDLNDNAQHQSSDAIAPAEPAGGALGDLPVDPLDRPVASSASGSSRRWFWPLLVGCGGLISLVLVGVWLWLRPSGNPQVLRFATTETQYPVTDENGIQVDFQVSYPRQIASLEILGQGDGGAVIGSPVTYDFSLGLPPELEENCTVGRQQLSCTDVSLEMPQAGDYTFTLTVVPEPGRDRAPSQFATPVSILPVPLPEILGFSPTQPNYVEAPPGQAIADPNAGEAPPANEGMVRLNWAIANPENLLALQIVGRSTEDAIVMPAQQFDWQSGIPEGLQPFCQVGQEQGNSLLVCQSIPTGVTQAGDYTFELSLLSKTEQRSNPIRKTTELIKVVPLPPRILGFSVNGNSATSLSVPVLPGQPPPSVSVAWRVAPATNTEVVLSPAPGTVGFEGAIPVQLSPDQETVLKLQVTNSAGQQVTRSIAISTFDPTANQPDTVVVGGEPTVNNIIPPANEQPAPDPDLTAPTPTLPGELSPSELPPQFD